MLSLLIIWFYIFVICFIYGCVAVKFLLLLLKEDTFDRIPLAVILILGLCLVSTIAGYLSLFLKIGAIAGAVMFLGALLLVSLYHLEIQTLAQSSLRRLFSMDKYLLALLLLSSLFILVKSTATPSSFDTGLYHAQAIRWIEEYPVVPGLGNLHGRLAFNSAWFLPNALFGFSFLKLQPFHVLNGFFLLIIVFFSLAGLDNIIKGQYNFSNILRSCISIPVILVFKDQLSSPTPDIPVALLICVIFIYYLQLQEGDADVPSHLLSLIIVILSAFTIIIKISALPLALFMLVIAFNEIVQHRPGNLFLMVVCVVFIVLPFFLRNIWLSGYLLYPFPGLDLFNFDWKIPAAEALIEKRSIEAFARDPGYVLSRIPVKGPFYWVPVWFQQTITDYGGKLAKIFLPGFVLFLDYLANMIRLKTCKIELKEICKNKVTYLTAFAGLAFWFFTAPDPRFAMGFLFVIPAIIFIPFLKAYNYQVTKLFPWCIGLLLLYFLVVFLPQDLPTLGQRLWFPAPYPQVALTIKEIQDKTVYFPLGQEQKCWYAPLPCTSYHSSKFAFRGERIEEGFRAQMAR